MAYAVTKSDKTLSRLGKRLCTSLLRERDRADIECGDTGDVIKARIDWERARKLSAHASGAHYIAYGYCYVLCYDPKACQPYVDIVREKDRKSMGKVPIGSLITHEIEG